MEVIVGVVMGQKVVRPKPDRPYRLLRLCSENPSEEVDDHDNYYYELIARNEDFWRAPEIDFHYETEARKVMINFKFDALYR